MTEDDLVDDLSRLLREGLVVVDQWERDDWEQRYDPTAVPRFYVTPRGLAQLDEPVDAPEDRR